MSRPYAWRVLGILPILKASACTNTDSDKDWQKQRRLDMYHRAMDPAIAEINELCKSARYYRWADKKVRLGQAFSGWNIISMDGDIAQQHHGTLEFYFFYKFGCLVYTGHCGSIRCTFFL